MSKSGRNGRLSKGRSKPVSGPGNHSGTGRRKGEKNQMMLNTYKRG